MNDLDHPNHLIEAACVIRGHLANLLSGKTDELDEILAILIAQYHKNSSPEVATQIRIVLEQDRATRQWLNEFLYFAVESNKDYKNYQSLPGHPESPLSPKYACPICGHIWHRFSVKEEIPNCKHCNVPFEQVLEDYMCPKGDYIWYIFDRETPIPQCPTHHNSWFLKKIGGLLVNLTLGRLR